MNESQAIAIQTRVGLWRSWERASMAWKRSSVRSRPGPPNRSQIQKNQASRILQDFQFDRKTGIVSLPLAAENVLGMATKPFQRRFSMPSLRIIAIPTEVAEA